MKSEAIKLLLIYPFLIVLGRHEREHLHVKAIEYDLSMIKDHRAYKRVLIEKQTRCLAAA